MTIKPMEPEGNLVATYQTEHCTVYIRDAAYAGKTEQELEAIREHAQRVAGGILYAKELRERGLLRSGA